MGLFGFDANAFATPVSRQDHTGLIATLAAKIVERRMALPAILLLQSVRPLSRLSGQALLCASPMLSLFVAADKITTACDLLDDPDNIERLLSAIERLEQEPRHAAS